MNLSDVYVFKKVASTLSFAQAARQIGVSRSAISKQVSRLEKDLGVILINRTTRSVNLTEAGRIFDAQTARIDRTLEDAVDNVRTADSNPLGTVSFTLPSALGSALMPALTTQFQQRWPDLKLNINFDDQVRDLIGNNLDLAIRISRKLTDSTLISRRLISTRHVLAASPGYLRAHGTPERHSDLENHRCLGRGSAVKPGTTWEFLIDGDLVSIPITFSMSTNNNLAAILAACLDSGVVYVPEICILGELARNQLQIIPGFDCPEPYGVYAIYPHRKAAAKVKVLVDYVESLLPNVATLDRWVPLVDRIVDTAKGSNGKTLMKSTTTVA